MKNDGLGLNGITRDLIRNRLVLCYSTDLITWVPFDGVVPRNRRPLLPRIPTRRLAVGTAATSWPYGRMACPERRGASPPARRANILEFPAHRRLPKPLTAMRRNPTSFDSAAPASLCTGKRTFCGLPAGRGIIEVRGRLDLHPSGAARCGGSFPSTEAQPASAKASRTARRNDLCRQPAGVPGPEAVRASKALRPAAGALRRPARHDAMAPHGRRIFVDKPATGSYRRSYGTPRRWLELPSQQEGASLPALRRNTRVAGTAPVPGWSSHRFRELRRTHITPIPIC